MQTSRTVIEWRISYGKNKRGCCARSRTGAEKIQPRPTKKEKKAKKAMEEARRAERRKKRKWYTIGALGTAGLAVFINFYFNSLYGTELYEWIEIGCFLLMGLAGGLMIMCSRYEETERQIVGKRNMGLIFIAIALGVVMMELVHMFMK